MLTQKLPALHPMHPMTHISHPTPSTLTTILHPISHIPHLHPSPPCSPQGADSVRVCGGGEVQRSAPSTPQLWAPQ